MPKLYELTEEYVDLSAMLFDDEYEDEQDAIIDKIDAVTSDISKKAEAYARIRINLKAAAKEYTAKANIFKEEADRLYAKAKSAENNIKRLNDHLLFAMEVAGLKQIPTSIGKFYTQETTSVDVLDAWKVPKEYAEEQPPKIDKNAIKKAFKATGEIPDGCEIRIQNGVRFR